MEKQEKIVSMFNDIAGTYDIANRVLSMGIDKSWRDKLMEERNFNKKIFEWKFRYSKVHNLFHFLWILF